MIAQLKGHIVTQGENWLVIDVSGVGYKLWCSHHTLHALGSCKEAVHVYTELVYNSENIALYGFVSEEEKSYFLMLTKIPGLGGKLALAVLSSLSPHKIHVALQEENVEAFKQVSGIGPKMARRIIVELKGALVKMPQVIEEFISPRSNIESDALSALSNLGYRASEVLPVIKKVIKDYPGYDLKKLLPLILEKLVRV